MGLLKPAMKDIKYAKVGILGLPKSGKTYTASLFAVGLTVKAGRKKPIGFFDTEGGSGYVLDKMKKAGCDLVRVQSRSFSDLCEVVPEAAKDCAALIIDSVTHPWIELCDSYLTKINQEREASRKRKAEKLEFQHWAYLKKIWREKFTVPYLTSQLHIFMCGRAGWEYEYIQNEETGRKELQKGDIKMQTERDLGYEPSLLLEMERVFDTDGSLKHRCIVLGDRFDLVNGKVFIDPSFKDFQPIWDSLDSATTHGGIDPTRTSDALLETPGIETDEKRFQRTILSEEIEGMLVSAFPGQSAAEKKAKTDILQAAFGTRSWTAIEATAPAQLREGKEVLQYLCFVLAKAKEEATEIPSGADFLPWLEQQKSNGQQQDSEVL